MAVVEEVRSIRRRRGARSWIAIAFLSGAAAFAPRQVRGEEPEVVVRVNGEPVTRAELERMVRNPDTLRHAQQLLGVEKPDPGALEGLALRKLVHLRLLVQEARRRKIVVTDKELDAEIASLRGRFADLKSFGAWMQEQGLPETALFETVRGDMAADRVRAALVEGVRVGDEEVQRYYEAHQDEFRPEEVRLQIIAVGDEAAAEEIMKALESGADFRKLARKRSRGLRAAQGGDTGWVAAESLGSPIREAVAKLNPRDARGPLKRGSDFLVVRLHDRRRGKAKGLAEVRPDIERRLLAEKRQGVVEAWLAAQEKKAKIEVLSASLKGPGGKVEGLGAKAHPDRETPGLTAKSGGR